MTFVGNLFLGIACLLFLLMFSTVYLKTQARGGDAAMGYAWGVMLSYLFFLVCMGIVAIAIGMNGGFEWIASSPAKRNALVIVGLFVTVIAAALCALFKEEPGPEVAYIRFFSGFAPALIPLLLIFSCAILLNSGLRESTSPAVYKLPLTLVFWLSVLILSLAIVGGLRISAQNAQRKMESAVAFQDEHMKRMLAEIDACNVEKDLVFLLVHTDRNQDQLRRDRAIAKIKTNPNWQKELIRLVESDWAPEAFNYLASNEVEDKTIFLEPIRKGIYIQADLIRKSIRKTPHFYPEIFQWEVDRVLWTLEKYEGQGVDYLPAVKALRAALDEPSDAAKNHLSCISTLDKWLKKRQ